MSVNSEKWGIWSGEGMVWAAFSWQSCLAWDIILWEEEETGGITWELHVSFMDDKDEDCLFSRLHFSSEFCLAYHELPLVYTCSIPLVLSFTLIFPKYIYIVTRKQQNHVKCLNICGSSSMKLMVESGSWACHSLLTPH